MITLLSIAILVVGLITVVRLMDNTKRVKTSYRPIATEPSSMVFKWDRLCAYSTPKDIKRLIWLRNFDGFLVKPHKNGYYLSECNTIVKPEWCQDRDSIVASAAPKFARFSFPKYIEYAKNEGVESPIQNGFAVYNGCPVENTKIGSVIKGTMLFVKPEWCEYD